MDCYGLALLFKFGHNTIKVAPAFRKITAFNIYSLTLLLRIVTVIYHIPYHSIILYYMYIMYLTWLLFNKTIMQFIHWNHCPTEVIVGSPLKQLKKHLVNTSFILQHEKIWEPFHEISMNILKAWVTDRN